MTSRAAASKETLAASSNSIIETSRQELFDLSLDVHAHLELDYEEYYSSDALASTKAW